MYWLNTGAIRPVLLKETQIIIRKKAAWWAWNQTLGVGSMTQMSDSFNYPSAASIFTNTEQAVSLGQGNL